MKLAAIAAMSRNRVIGLNNRLPWHLPEDLRFFKSKTKGSVVIMGRKTFESLKGPLPHRENIVLSRNPEFAPSGVTVFSDLTEALEECRGRLQEDQEVFVAGGAEIYRQALPVVDRVYLTVIDRDYEGDTWFPELPADFHLIETKPARQSEPEALDYEFRTYSRS